MALKRSMLSSMGLNEEQISTIIEAHTETVNGLKKELETSEEAAEELAKTKKELQKAQKQIDALKEAQGDEAKWQEKYEKIKTEFDEYKSGQEATASLEKKKKAFIKILQEANIVESAHDNIVDVTKFDDISIGDDGEIENKDDVMKGVKDKWGGFVKQVSSSGTNTKTPPNAGSAKLTREEISKIKDTSERQSAYARLLEEESKGE